MARARRALLLDDEKYISGFNKHYFMRAIAYLKPYRKIVVLSLLAMIVCMLCGLASPLLIGKAIDVCKPGGDYRQLLWIVAGLAAAASLGAVMLRTKVRLMNVSGRRALAAMREDLFNHIQTLAFDFFDSRPAGKIMIRVINDIESLLNMFSQGIVNMISNSLSIVAIAGIMLAVNWRLALVAFSMLPLLILLIFVLRPKIRQAWRVTRWKSSSLNAYLHESLAGMRVTQAFTREEENSNIFRNANGEIRRTWMKAILIGSAMWPGFEIVASTGTCLIYWFGVHWMGAPVNPVTMGTLFTMAWYLGRFWDPLNQISTIYYDILSAMASLERIFEIMDTPAIIKDKPGAYKLPEMKGRVEFDHVSFGYDFEAGQVVLDDVSFVVEPGKTVALVGPTGAGKSTVVSLVSRFYDANRGRVLVDGHDVRDVELRSLRRQMGLMLQDTFIFSGTLMDNIRYGRLDATDEEVIDAAKAVHAHEFISMMENGYNTEVLERGSRLSTGQKQLISFARALLANPRILILDEATASIDTHTEILIQQALEKLLKGRTSFVIAHRLSTIRKADCIMVVNQGKIVETGNHEELLEKNGAYHDLCEAQFRYMKAV
jgi:ATP-binding cassette, subfamily B, multidrug efflux pump